MGLSNDLISQFAKITKDKKETKKESTVYGTVVKYNGRDYVKMDGSELLTPVTSTTDTENGERVTVTIKNHTATVTGNLSSPAARTDTVKEQGGKISEFEIVVADKVSTKELEAERGRIDELVADNVTIKDTLKASNAEITELKTKNLEVAGKLTAAEADIDNLTANKLDAEVADLKYAEIKDLKVTNEKVYNLEGTYGDFSNLTADKFAAVDGIIADLEVKKLDATQAEIKYANIDFTNVGKIAMENFYANSGLIKDVVVGDQNITGELVGVTIKGDLIEGNTVKADKLVVKGSDGIYYKLNFESGAFKNGETVPDDSLHGSVITAKSITAEKVSVYDLVAFDATIGGFNITENSIYSGVKETVDNTTRGVYLDNNGQVAFGDSRNFIKYYKDQNGIYRLAISASSIVLGGSGRDIESAFEDLESVEVGGRNLIRNSANMIFEEYYFDETHNSTQAILGTGIVGHMILGTG